MIYDNISNIRKYAEIPRIVIDFIEHLNAETFPGHYEIDTNSYANIDCYSTKQEGEGKLESHIKYIDIQILLSGEERLDYIETSDLKISEPYDADRDIIFYEKTNNFLNSVKLSSGKFILLYPYEAHQPQMAIDESIMVKKVVIKIKA